MNNYIKTDISKCDACNNCIRCCPADANKIIFDSNNNLKADIIDERCIQCGECIRECMHGARHYVDDTERFFNDIRHYETAVIVAPAVYHNFKNYKNLIGYLKRMGVHLVYDISFGADITTWAYLKLYQNNMNKSVISQPCPAIVNYIEHFEPSLIPSLAPVHSPTLCAAIYLKKYEHFNGRIAMLSPCIAKESEFFDTNTENYVQYNVTISKLKEYLDKNKVDLNNYQATEFDNVYLNLGFTFSRPGGLKENVDYYTSSTLWIRQVEGTKHAIEYLKEYKKRKNTNRPLPQLVDILNCVKGCNCGTATNNDVELDDIDVATNKMKRKFLNTEVEANSYPDPYISLFDKFDHELKPEDFTRLYTNKSSNDKYSSKYKATDLDEKIEQIFMDLGKDTKAKREHNCDACGFHTCINFAHAVCEGRAVINGCMYYSFAFLNRTFEDVKVTLKDNLEKTVEKLQDIEENQQVLHDVARNINLISINASIEAASAGAYGKGFAVVASEIKKLADKSKNVTISTSKSNSEIKSQLDTLQTSLNKILAGSKTHNNQ